MTSLIGIFFASFVAALSGAIMPGPLLTATIGESVRCGVRAGPLITAGHALLELPLVAAFFLGLAPLLTNSTVTAGIGIAGGCILFWLAWGMFRSLPNLAIDAGAPLKQGHGRLISQGILISLSNPYWSVWWATIGLACVLQSRAWGLAGVIAFFIGHILADLAWYSCISLAIGKGRRFFTPVVYRGLVGACAVFLVVFAGWFLFGGIHKFMG